MPVRTDHSRYDLAVAYRIYPQVAKPALGLPFSDDKFQLAEICLSSLKQSLGDLRARVWVLLDGCPSEYVDLFRRYFDAQDLVFIPLAGVGNVATFAKQVEILLAQEDSNIVYFAEDDYFYLPGESLFDDQFSVGPRRCPFCFSLRPSRLLHDGPASHRKMAESAWRTTLEDCRFDLSDFSYRQGNPTQD